MNNTTLLVAIIAVLIGTIAGYTLGEYRNGSWGHYSHMGMTGGDDTYRFDNRDYDRDNDEPTRVGMMDHSMHMDMMVTNERDFLNGMIPHHEEAVVTAKEVLARGATTPEMKTLAESIIVAQEKEIADMKSWYKSWYGTDYAATGDYTPMMRDLTTQTGAALDKAFLEDMIMHHMGAIMMAQSVAPYAEHDEIKSLTEAIITTQSAEIDTMRNLLRTKY